MGSEKEQPKRSPYDFLRMWSITLPLILAVGLLGFLGYLLDDFLNFNFPLFTLLGIFAGLTGAVYRILRSLNNK